MTGAGRAVLGVALPMLAIAIFVVLLAFSLMRLAEIERDMRIEATQNMLWVISRAHIASLQLGETVAGGEIDLPDLERRYNVFLSRLVLLDDGPQRRQMEALGFGEVLDEFRQRLPELGALIEGPAGQEQTGAIKQLLASYETVLGHAANRAMVAEWDGLGARLDTSRRQLWQIIISLVGISLAGAVLCAHFLLATREAKRRMRLLDKEKAFSQLLIGSSGEGIVVLDLKRRCTVWNEAAERLFGLPAGKTIGRALEEVSGFFEVEAISRAFDAALAGEPAQLFDQPFFPPANAAPVYVDLRWFSLRDGEHIVGSILLATDVTERRAVQRQIADHRDLLEHLVQERTRELDAALTRERATADLYRNFGAMISHQFRTPLAIIDSALQRLMRRADRLSPDEVLERGGNARQAITRLTRLVESTLDAARLDAGQIEIQARPCDLGKLAAEICARQQEQTPERQIKIHLEADVPAIACCDPVHAENILANLLSNAVKYSATQTAIEVVVIKRDDEVECAVKNRGDIGSLTERDAVFDRYFRGGNAEGHPGVGIGLYMARALARMQGGDVQLADSDGQHVVFVLRLPQAGAEASEMKAPLTLAGSA